MPIYKIKLDPETVRRLDIIEMYQGARGLTPEIKDWLNTTIGREVDIDTMVQASLKPERNYRLWNFTRSRDIQEDGSYIFRFLHPDDLMLFKLRWH